MQQIMTFVILYMYKYLFLGPSLSYNNTHDKCLFTFIISSECPKNTLTFLSQTIQWIETFWIFEWKFAFILFLDTQIQQA